MSSKYPDGTLVTTMDLSGTLQQMFEDDVSIRQQVIRGIRYIIETTEHDHDVAKQAADLVNKMVCKEKEKRASSNLMIFLFPLPFFLFSPSVPSFSSFVFVC